MNSVKTSPKSPSAANAVRRWLPYAIPLVLVAGAAVAFALMSGGGKGGEKEEAREGEKLPKKEEEEGRKLPPAEGDDREVIEALRKQLGGVRIEQDDKAKGKPVVLVSMRGNFVTDEYVALLKGLKGLRTLELAFTLIT